MNKAIIYTPLAAVCLALLGMPAALATDVTTTFQVSGTISTSCTVTALDLDFGQLSAVGPTDGQTTITVNCASGVAYTVDLAGTSPGCGDDNGAEFCLFNSSSVPLAYWLYSDAGHTTLWGRGTTVAGTGAGADQTLTVYGQTDEPHGQGTGTYTDTVTVTVAY